MIEGKQKKRDELERKNAMKPSEEKHNFQEKKEEKATRKKDSRIRQNEAQDLRPVYQK